MTVVFQILIRIRLVKKQAYINRGSSSDHGRHLKVILLLSYPLSYPNSHVHLSLLEVSNEPNTGTVAMTLNAEINTQSPEVERLLKITNIMEIIGCARSKVYELVKAGILPPPIYITPTMPRWQKKSVNEAIAKLAENSQK